MFCHDKFVSSSYTLTIDLGAGFTTLVLLGVWDAEGGGGKTNAESAALHEFELNTTPASLCSNQYLS